MRFLIFTAIAVAAVALPADAGTQLGPLPAGAISRSAMGPADELILYLAFDVRPFATRLPAGVRFRTLEEMAREYAGIAKYLHRYPERKSWGWSFFEIIGSETVVYDGVRARPGGGMAVWYPEIVRTDLSDTRPRGDTSLALGTWIADSRLAVHMRKRGYPAEWARIEFRRTRDAARGLLQTQDFTIEGRCALQGSPFVPAWARTPLSYETFWTPRGRANTFEVVTWAGHKARKCVKPVWRVSGTHPLARALRDPALGDMAMRPTEFSYGYRLRGALYRSR